MTSVPPSAVPVPVRVRGPGPSEGGPTTPANYSACIPSSGGTKTTLRAVWDACSRTELKEPLPQRRFHLWTNKDSSRCPNWYQHEANGTCSNRWTRQRVTEFLNALRLCPNAWTHHTADTWGRKPRHITPANADMATSTCLLPQIFPSPGAGCVAEIFSPPAATFRLLTEYQALAARPVAVPAYLQPTPRTYSRPLMRDNLSPPTWHRTCSTVEFGAMKGMKPYCAHVPKSPG